MINGYQKTSLNSIAKQLSVTKPALYYYFPSKKDLFLACLTYFFSKLAKLEKKYKPSGNSTKEKLKDILLNFSQPFASLDLNLGTEGFNHYYFIFDAIKNVPESTQFFMELSSNSMNDIYTIINEGVQNHELRDDLDVEAAVFEIGVLIEGFGISFYMGYFNDKEEMIDRIFELIWNGLKLEN